MIIKVKVRKTSQSLYPSAKMLAQACFEDYKNEMESYNKIYEKVNITLAFCSVVMLVIIDRFDFCHIENMVAADTATSLCYDLFLFALSLISAVLIACATIQLLGLMRGSRIRIFNSQDILNERIYFYSLDKASLWLIRAYTDSIDNVRTITGERQKKYDKTVVEIVFAILFYAVYLLLNAEG